DTLQLAGIICYTATGSTALRVARERPGLAVIGLSPVVATGRKLALVWGVHCVLTSDPENQAAMVRKACRHAFDQGLAQAGEGRGGGPPRAPARPTKWGPPPPPRGGGRGGGGGRWGPGAPRGGGGPARGGGGGEKPVRQGAHLRRKARPLSPPAPRRRRRRG